MVGETEESLKKQGIDYVVGRARYADNARGQIIGDKDGFLKLLFRRDDMKLVGVHVMGELATEIVHIGLMAMLTIRPRIFLSRPASMFPRWACSTKPRR